MFSGLTNQVSSWMGKGEVVPAPVADEKTPTSGLDDPTADPVFDLNASNQHPAGIEGETLSSEPAGVAATSTKREMLSNVKSQFEGLGGWINNSIPKLNVRRGDGVGASAAATPGAGDITAEDVAAGLESGGGIEGLEGLEGGTGKVKDDDDNSSATGGADSGPQSLKESPTDETKDNQFGNVQSKALAGAKSFGSFLYSAVNKAGKTVSEASAKIKKTVEENSLLGEFNKEQEAFARKQAENAAAALPPWTGCSNEQTLKDECLSLSTDKRNFVRSPPAGVDFVFDYEVSYPVAMSIMEQDPNLEKMRYELVPKLITEENFWRNYFYRVSLICQASELSFMSRGGEGGGVAGVGGEAGLDIVAADASIDTLHATSEDMDEVQAGMIQLALGVVGGVTIPPSAGEAEDEWEKELEAELQDYEVVSEQKSSSSKTDNWEQEMDEMLDDDDDIK